MAEMKKDSVKAETTATKSNKNSIQNKDGEKEKNKK